MPLGENLWRSYPISDPKNTDNIGVFISKCNQLYLYFGEFDISYQAIKLGVVFIGCHRIREK